MKHLLLIILFSFCLPAGVLNAQESDASVNMDRLWLPKSYSKYWANLREVAEHQLAQARCSEVVRAELDQGASSADAPVFAVICRDQNRKTYAVKYDGLSKQPLISIEDSQELEEAQDDVPEVDMELVIYHNCQALWLNDVALMNKLSWLDDFENSVASERKEIELVSDDALDSAADLPTTITQYTFVRRFDAQDAAGNTLKYNANCIASGAGDVSTHISIRRD